MKHLWTPWRMPFIREHKALKGCVFCDLVSQGVGESTLILYRGSHAFVIFNKYPYNPGHLMVIPNRHTADFLSFSKDELLELHELKQRALAALKEEMKPQGFNIGMNLGEAGGAGIKDHLHYHVVPRWNGDTNFMPMIGETKVLPEALDATYRRMRPYFG